MHNDALLTEPRRPQPSYRGNATKLLILAAIVASTWGLTPANAAEGNGEPFPNNFGNVTSYATRSAPQVADTGSSAYPNVVGWPGSDLPRLAGNVLPTSGSEGAVQTANSLPARFEEGTVAYAQATSIRNWMVAHASRSAPAYAFATPRRQ